MVLEMNVEPQVTQNDLALVAVNDVQEVLLRNPGNIFIDNECLIQKETNGVNVLAAIYTWARVRDISVQYNSTSFNCDHLSTFFMIGQAEWTTYTTVSSLASGLPSYNFHNGQLSKLMIEDVHMKNV